MNCVGSLKGQVWPIERVSSMLGGATGIGMIPCILSKGPSDSKLWWPTLETSPGAVRWARKKDHLLKCEVSIVFGFYILLSRQVVPQFQLSACFNLVLLLQWSSIYQSVNWETRISTARCCPRISLQHCKLTAETTSHSEKQSAWNRLALDQLFWSEG